MKHHIKHLITTFTLVILLITSVTKPAYAIGPVFDLTNLPFNIGSFLEETMSQVNSFEQTLKDLGLDKIAFIVAQTASQKLTSSITNSLNGGASGDEPEQFIKDFGKHFENIAFQESQKYVDGLLSDQSKNPFSSQIGSSLVSSLGSGTTSALDKFSLGTTLGVDTNDLSSGALQQKLTAFSNDATVGGYSGLFALGFPENTPIGSRIIAEEELANKIEIAKENTKTELTSSGYTGKKTCTESSNSIINSFGGEQALGENPPSDCVIESPSGLNQESGNIALGESFNRLQNVDELGELVSSSLTQISSTLISKGLSKLGTSDLASQRNTTYGGARDVQQYFSDGNQGNGAARPFPSVVIDFGKELNPALVTTEEELAVLEETLVLFRKSPQIAHDLDTCTPGPDSGWADRLDKYYTKKIDGIIKKVSEDEDATDEQAAMDYLEPRFNRSIEEMREFTTNPWVNIPGAGEAQTKLQSYSQKAKQFQKIFNQAVSKRSELNSLKSIAANAKTVDQSLVLTYSDWDALGTATKIALYQESLVPFPEGDPVRFIQGQTTITSEQDERIKLKVIEYQWNLWEERAGTINPEMKKDLFLKFNEMRGSMSSDASLARAQAFLGEIDQDQEEMKKLLGECFLTRNLLTGHNFAPVSIQYQPGTEIEIYDGSSLLKSTNIFRAGQIADQLSQGNYTPGIELQNLVNELAALFPDFRTTITRLLLAPSILHKQFDPGINTNAYGDELQIGPALTAEDLLEQDASGELFCRLPKEFGANPTIYATTNKTFLELPPGQDFGGSDDKIVGMKPIFCSEPKSLSLLGASTNLDSYTIKGFRDNVLKNPGVWYFSNGLEDYIFFDKTSVGSSI